MTLLAIVHAVAPREKTGLSAADRVLRVLAAFRDAPGELGVTQVSQAVGLDKSVVHRILGALADHDFLERNDDTRRYRVGLRAWEVGRRYTVGSWVYDAAVPLLAELAVKTDCTGYIGSLDGIEIVYLAAVGGTGPIRINEELGSRIEAHSTALGRAILSELPDDELTAVVGRIGLAAEPRRGDRVAPRDHLMREIEETRHRGYAINRGEARAGIGSVGAAIKDARGRPIAAISLAFPLLPGYDRLWQVLPSPLMRIATEVSRRIA